MSAGSTSLMWQALECLAGIDWNALFFWCLITFSLCLVSILLISIFLPLNIKEDEHIPPVDHGQPPQGLEVFQQLFSQKLLPVNSTTGWHLTGVNHELRSWEKNVNLGGELFSLHGSCAIIPSHSQGIIDTLKDIGKFMEWDNQVIGCSYISLPTTTDASDHPLMADVVNLTLTFKQSLPDAILDKVLAVLTVPYKFFSTGTLDLSSKNAPKPAIVARTWKMEEDLSCWMFSRTVFKGKGHTLDELWSYSLAQPAEDDPNKTVMHHIICTLASQNSASQNEKPALRLAALKQYFDLEELNVRPLHHTSLNHVSSHHRVGVKGHGRANGHGLNDGGPMYYSAQESCMDREVEAKFLPVFSTRDLPNHASDSYEATRTPTSSRSNNTRKLRASSLGVSGTRQEESSSDDAIFFSERRELPPRYRKQKVKKCFSAEVRGDTGEAGSTGSLERTGGEKGSGDFDENGLVGNLLDYQTIADQGAWLVLEECLKAAAINVNATEADQKEQTGGWSFHSLEKDVVILKRQKKGKYYSFLGKGIIKASPETVFKAIRNPRTRFTYDTMLKKMNIVRTISEDLIVYRTVHEVPQLLRKESRDFCLLQVCKTEGNRHIVAFRSIDWRECPESESMARGHVLPSGWVIESVGDRQAQYSMVTYVVQVALNGKEPPASFYQFLSVRVPLSLAYLRFFLEAQLP